MNDTSAASLAPSRPAPGDRVLGCEHGPDPHACHYFYLADGLHFVTPGSEADAHWLLLCPECFATYGARLDAHLSDGNVPIGCDMVWPESLDVRLAENAACALEDVGLDGRPSLQAIAERELAELVPDGYARTFVRPPWAGERRSSGCRGCGTHAEGVLWTVATLVRVNDAERSALFTFVMLCQPCTTDEARMRELADRAFASQ